MHTDKHSVSHRHTYIQMHTCAHTHTVVSCQESDNLCPHSAQPGLCVKAERWIELTRNTTVHVAGPTSDWVSHEVKKEQRWTHRILKTFLALMRLVELGQRWGGRWEGWQTILLDRQTNRPHWRPLFSLTELLAKHKG